jgi:CheY-like chemotaxis protein
MPEKDGLELATEVVADATLPRPAMILLTSRGERLAPEQMEAHGLSACELKPVHAEKLRVTLARAFKNARPAALDAKVETEIPATQRAATILVAEDNPVNQKVTLLQLRNLGYTADVVGNGAEAFAALRNRPYALVLMDAQMPKMDGLEATRQIREAEALGKPGFTTRRTIIAMTANAMTGDREACIAAGMDDYLAKPVKSGALRDTLARYLNPGAATEASGALAFAK